MESQDNQSEKELIKENKVANKTELDRGKSLNILINASNQANLIGTENSSPIQLNSLFVFVSPYELEDCAFEGLDIDLKMDEHGDIWVNNKPYKPIEIKPGVCILGIAVRD